MPSQRLGNEMIFPFSFLTANNANLVVLGCNDSSSRDEWLRVLRLLLDGQPVFEDDAQEVVAPPAVSLASMSASAKTRSFGVVPDVIRAERAPSATAPAVDTRDRWRLREIVDGVRLFLEEEAPSVGPGWEALLEGRGPPFVVVSVAVSVVVWTSSSLAAVAAALAAAALVTLLGILTWTACFEARRTGCVRATTIVHAPADDVFAMVMGLGPARFEWDVTFDGGGVIETLDRHSDVVRLQLAPRWLGAFPACRRDVCVLRYWRCEGPGSYTVISLSSTHGQCPVQPGTVRAEIHGSAFTIRPVKHASGARDGGHSQRACIVSHVLHIDPAGWLGSSKALATRFQMVMASSLRGLRYYAEQQQMEEPRDDVLAHSSSSPGLSSEALAGPSWTPEGADRRECTAGLDGVEDAFPRAEGSTESLLTRSLVGFGSKRAPDSPPAEQLAGAGSLPRAVHADDRHCWLESDPSLFKLRGKTYLMDRVKIPAEPESALMQLVAVDFLRDSSTLRHVAERPGCPATVESRSNFQFIVNFQLPGPPFLSLVLYFAVDVNNPNDPHLMSRLLKFANEYDDMERSETLKLIPNVHEGSWMVRRAVGQTPAIIGRALDTAFYTGDGYCEVDIDVGSSSVAAGVLRIVRGAAKSLIVDLAFLLEGATEEDLPERLLGTVRLLKMDVDAAAGDGSGITS